MKPIYAIAQKMKIAISFAIVLVLLVISNRLEQRNIDNLNDSFTSIYNDRLIPATEIFYLTENLYSKRLAMEDFLMSGEGPGIQELEKQLAVHDRTIEALVLQFEKTHLVKNESVLLSRFKDKVQEYRHIELSILALCSNGSIESAEYLFNHRAEAVFHGTIASLSDLTRVQMDVGEELVADTKVSMASVNILSNFQLALAVVIGLVIQVLIFTSRVSAKTQKKFHLN